MIAHNTRLNSKCWIDMHSLKQIEKIPFRGELKSNVPLAPLTTWRIGGPAELYFSPADVDDLQAFLRHLPEEVPVTWLGLGSNVLIQDGGIDGVVIHTKNCVNQIETLPLETSGEKTLSLRVEAGVNCAKLAKLCEKEGFHAGSFFAGIPGTIGGALRMNAGAWGSETWEQVRAVELIDRSGEIYLEPKEAFEVGYRKVSLPETHWFLAGHFEFRLNEQAPLEDSRTLLRKRNLSQPIGVFSCGSVFTNPPGFFAAKLIEESNLKGYRVGDAEVSPKHANFIINRAQASSEDILRLINHIKERVYAEHGVQLKTEVKVLGKKLNEPR